MCLPHSAWCAAPTFDLRSQYLQVDLRKIHAVSAVSTQGAIKEKSWVSGFLVHYSLDGTDWIVFANNKGEVKVGFVKADFFIVHPRNFGMTSTRVRR